MAKTECLIPVTSGTQVDLFLTFTRTEELGSYKKGRKSATQKYLIDRPANTYGFH